MLYAQRSLLQFCVYMHVFVHLFETSSHYVAHVGLELAI
jgi:hypothetical protein